MSTFENKLVSRLLRVMRRRRFSAPEGAPEHEVVPQGPGTRVQQREVGFSDFKAVSELKERSGLSVDSLANWHRLWQDNAALCFAKLPLSMGWVLEADSRIVGYLGSIPLLYHFGDKPLLAATASGFAVEPRYRAFSIGLVASFYRQKNIDLFLNTSAIESVGKLALGFGADALPQKDYDRVLFWVLDARKFVEAVALKFGVNGTMRTVGGMLGSFALGVDRFVRRRRPNPIGSELKTTEVFLSEIGNVFEDFWLRKLAEKPRLLADRGSAGLRWHFTVPEGRRQTNVFCCKSQDRLVGYAIVRGETDPKTGLRRCLLADMLVERDDPDTVRSLIVAVYDFARQSGCQTLEILGYPKNLRQVVLQWNPYSRKFPACPFYFKAKDRALHEMLKAEDSWYACPFDGDTTLMP